MMGRVRIVARERTSDRATDFKAILAAIKGRNPDVIFYGGIDATGGPMLNKRANSASRRSSPTAWPASLRTSIDLRTTCFTNGPISSLTK